MRINAILDEDIVDKIDCIAKEEKKSRSNILREAAEKLINEYQILKEEKLRKERFRSAMKTQDKLREKAGHWDGVSEIRKWRES